MIPNMTSLGTSIFLFVAALGGCATAGNTVLVESVAYGQVKESAEYIRLITTALEELRRGETDEGSKRLESALDSSVVKSHLLFSSLPPDMKAQLSGNYGQAISTAASYRQVYHTTHTGATAELLNSIFAEHVKN